MEVVRDKNDNCIIICSIENVDPMGIHTGDSITVAPAQTLTDKEYQRMRDASIAVLRKIGVDTGGSNVQFALSPNDGRLLVIEMNPRVSRSSALASKATGFPIAKVAAKLAIGYTLDELQQRDHGRCDAGIVRADHRLRRHEGSAVHVREVSPSCRSTDHADEIRGRGHGDGPHVPRVAAKSLARFGDRHRRAESGAEGGGDGRGLGRLRHELKMAGSSRLWYVADAFRFGSSLDEVAELTAIDRWFLSQIQSSSRSRRTSPKKAPPFSRPRSCASSSAGVSVTGGSRS